VELNNREIALLVIVGILIIPALFKKIIRESVINLLKIFFSGNLQIIFKLSLIYILCSLIFLSKINFWDFALLKGTLIWIIFASFALMLNVNKSSNEDYFIKKIIISNFKVIILIEFISNLFVFSFIVELILQTILVFVGLMLAVSETESKFEVVHKIFNSLASFLGISIFTYTIYSIVDNFDKVFTVDNFRDLILPIILTILYMPFIYILALYAKYEIYFVRLNHINRGNKLNSYAKTKMLLKLNIRLRKLVQFTRNYPVMHYSSKEEIRDIFKNAV
jgi:hypothetical protein